MHRIFGTNEGNKKTSRVEVENLQGKRSLGIPWMSWNSNIKLNHKEIIDRLCGLVVRVPGYRSRGPGFDSRRCQIYWEVVGLERCPLSLVSTIEELLGRKSSGSGLQDRCVALTTLPPGNCLYNVGILIISQPCRPPRPDTEIALLTFSNSSRDRTQHLLNGGLAEQ
jgi:hypothetical protein